MLYKGKRGEEIARLWRREWPRMWPQHTLQLRNMSQVFTVIHPICLDAETPGTEMNSSACFCLNKTRKLLDGWKALTFTAGGEDNTMLLLATIIDPATLVVHEHAKQTSMGAKTAETHDTKDKELNELCPHGCRLSHTRTSKEQSHVQNECECTFIGETCLKEKKPLFMGI